MPTMLNFELSGIPTTACRGVAIVHMKEGEPARVPIDSPQVAIPDVRGRRKIEFAVDGYCLAEYFGPGLFDEPISPIPVTLVQAGSLAVQVIDENGTLLPNRLVYCHLIAAPPTDGPIRHRTTVWAHSDKHGIAQVEHVIPGDYVVTTGEIAEWLEADLEPVRVSPNLCSPCTLRVPVRPQDEFGGFTLAPELAEHFSQSSSGRVRDYVLLTEDHRSFNIYRVGDDFRCAVPGMKGETIRGRIQERVPPEGSAPRQSSEITIVVGTVLPATVTWSPPVER
jgi:hypothetical protein